MILLQSLPTSSFFESVGNFFLSLGVAEGILILLVIFVLIGANLWLVNYFKVKRDKFKDNYLELKDDYTELIKEYSDRILTIENDHKNELLYHKEKYIRDATDIIINYKTITEDIIEKVDILIDNATREYITLSKYIIDEKDKKIDELNFIINQLNERIKKRENCK